MIDVKKRLPQVYSQSYDMSVFTGLLNLIYNAREVDNLRAKVSHCPLHCFEEDIPRLASLLGLPATATRDILSTYRRLVKIKGSSTAVKKAVLSPSRFTLANLGTVPQADKQDFVFVLPDLEDYNWDLLFSLLHRLAPVNCMVQVEPEFGHLAVPIKGEGDQEGKEYPALANRANKPITPIVEKLVTGNQTYEEYLASQPTENQEE